MIFDENNKRDNHTLNFHDSNFWRFYQSFEPLSIEQFINIGFDLKYDDENILLPYSIDLDCDDKFYIQIKIYPYRFNDETIVENSMVYLNIVDKETNESKHLGWWDEGQWHPFCLRWCELITLSKHIAEKSSILDERVVFVLLCRFTGISDKEFFDKNEWLVRKNRVKEAYLSIGIQGEESEALINNTIFLTDDYQWVYNEKTGWEFSGEYPCYSIRNNAHFSNDEESFPFEWFNELIGNIGQVF